MRVSSWVMGMMVGLTVSVCAETVQVRKAAIRERASFLGRVLGHAGYGEQLKPSATRGAWVQVSRDGRILGWVHASALTRRAVDLRSGEDVVDASVSSDELALAGKGFSAEVEAEFRTRHGDAGFAQLGRMEDLEIPSGDRMAFLKAGGLTPRSGDQP